jgi:hypothetical protein
MRTISYLAVFAFLASAGAVRAGAEWDYFAQGESQNDLEPSRLDKVFDVSSVNVSQLADPGSSQGPPQPPAAPSAQANASSTSSGNAQSDCCDCCRPRNWWVRVEYIDLWIQGVRVPALVTTSPNGTPQADAGVLPGARVLFGNDTIDEGARSGGRGTLGYWFDDDHGNGIVATWITVGRPTGVANFAASSLGTPILARPFFNVSTGQNDAQLMAFPGLVEGQPGAPATIQITTATSLDVGEISLVHTLNRDNCSELLLIGGYRYLRFGENLTMLENIIPFEGGAFDPNNSLNVADQFEARNEFEGAQLGVQFMRERGNWELDGAVKLGLGNVHESVVVVGSTTFFDSNTSTFETRDGGFLAQASNEGLHSRNRLGFLPEVDLNLRYKFSERFDLMVGYTFMYLSSVVRAGDQIDTAIDSTTLPTASGTTGTPGNRPAFVLHETSLWAQGISGGIEFRF